MYTPPAFAVTDPATLAAFVRQNPLGLLVTVADGRPEATPVPFELSADGTRLTTHLARANDQWRTADGADALVVFQGPASYVTPSWYATKREHGKVVPTWNYAIVEARGRATVHQDAAWLRAQVERVTDAREAARPDRWRVDDAPEPFVAAMLRGIVGIEIAVASITGKWKVSQNRPEADRAGVAAGLAAEGDHAMARLVEAGGA